MGRFTIVFFLSLSFFFTPLFAKTDHAIFSKSEAPSSEISNKKRGDDLKCPTCGTVPFPSNTGNVTPNPIIDSSKVWSFVSEPHLHPMKVKVKKNKPGIASGSIFLAPYAFSEDAGYGQQGTLILDNEGNPIWFKPSHNSNLMNTDFRVQKLGGESVLTFWQGTLVTPPTYTNVPAGSSEPGSCYYILDKTYRTIKTVEARKGYTSDIHEFLLTPHQTALFLSTQAVPMDLTPYGGATKRICARFCDSRNRFKNK